MIRPNRRMSELDALQLLRNGKYGILSTSSSDGIPYGVPMNYFYSQGDNSIYFHCFIKGRKLDNIRQNDKVSFVVIGKETIVDDLFVTHYESVLVEGRATLIADEKEKTKKLIQLCETLTPEATGRRDEVIKNHLSEVMIVKLLINKISGKRNQDD